METADEKNVLSTIVIHSAEFTSQMKLFSIQKDLYALSWKWFYIYCPLHCETTNGDKPSKHKDVVDIKISTCFVSLQSKIRKITFIAINDR